MASAKLNEEKLEKKFQLVTNSQDSIQTLSLWILYHKSQHKKIADIWLKTLKKSKVSHRLVLLYVANDVIQTCKKKSAPQFAETFSEILAEACLLIRDEKIRPMVERVFNVWEQRSVFTSEFIDELRGILSNPKVQSVSHKFVAEFKPQKVMEKIRKIKKIELESVTKLSACSSSKLDCSSSDIIYQLKDRTHGQQIVYEFDEAVRCLQEYIQIVEKELYERTQLIELLEKGETFYNAQNGEVKVVANAYRTFSGRVKNQKKKLDELISTIPSPVPSPCPDAPSPTNSDEGPSLSPLLENKTKFQDVEPVEEKQVKVSVQETKSPKKLPIEIVMPQNKQLLLPKQTMTPPIAAKQSPRPTGLEESATGMTSWIGTFNTNNPTFTKTFSLDPRISQNSSLETRLSSLMENIPNLPTIFKSSVFENQTPSTGSTPVRVDLSNINSPARQMPPYRESQSDIGELGTPVNDENRRDATPVEDEDTRFSGSNALPQVVSVVSSLTSDDLHQSLLKSLTHLQQISAANPSTSNIPSMIPESYMGLSNARANLSGGYPQTLPPMNKTSPPNSPLYMKSMSNKPLYSTNDRSNSSNIYTSKSLPFPTHPMQQPKIASAPIFNKTESVTSIFSKAESTPNIFSKADTGSMIFSKAESAPMMFNKTEPSTMYNKTEPAIVSYSKTEPSSMMFSKPDSTSLMYNKTDSTSLMFSKSESTPSCYPYASRDTDERFIRTSPKVDHDRYLHSSPKSEQNVSHTDFSAEEEENLEPMDMDIGESDEEDSSVPNIQESLPQTSVDIDLRIPPPSQIMSSSSTSWSTNIHTNVSSMTTVPISSNSSKTDHDISLKSNSQPVESLPSQCAPIQSIKSLADTKPVGSYDIFEKNISDIPPLDNKNYNDEDMRQDNRNFPDRIQNDENKVSISQAQSINKSDVNYFSEDFDDRQTNTENSTAQPKTDPPLDGNRIQTVQSVRVDNSEWDWNKEIWEQRPSPTTPNRRRGQSFYDRRFPSPGFIQRFPQDPFHPSYHPRNQWNSHDSDYRRHYNPPPFNPRFPPPIAGLRGNFPPRYPM